MEYELHPRHLNPLKGGIMAKDTRTQNEQAVDAAIKAGSGVQDGRQGHGHAPSGR